jgi:hypothetical protein
VKVSLPDREFVSHARHRLPNEVTAACSRGRPRSVDGNGPRSRTQYRGTGMRFPRTDRSSPRADSLVLRLLLPVVARNKPARVAPIGPRCLAPFHDTRKKLLLLHGTRDPSDIDGAGCVPDIPRLGIPAMRMADLSLIPEANAALNGRSDAPRSVLLLCSERETEL